MEIDMYIFLVASEILHFTVGILVVKIRMLQKTKMSYYSKGDF